jgi:hypothetical protein
MQNVKLTPKQESCVKLSNNEGFTNEINRKDIIYLKSKKGIIKPALLKKKKSYKLNTAS